MQFLTVIGQFVTAYVLLPYTLRFCMCYGLYYFTVFGHLQHIFCIHLTQALYDTLNRNSPLHKAHVFVHST